MTPAPCCRIPAALLLLGMHERAAHDCRAVRRDRRLLFRTDGVDPWDEARRTQVRRGASGRGASVQPLGQMAPVNRARVCQPIGE